MPDRSMIGRFRPCAMGANLSSLLVMRPIALPKAEDMATSNMRRINMSRVPANCGRKPIGQAMMMKRMPVMQVMMTSCKTGPASRANLLMGVTRSLSMSPQRSSSIMPNPEKIPPEKASEVSIPGTKRVNVLLLGKELLRGMFFNRGAKRNRYKTGVVRPMKMKTGFLRVATSCLINKRCISRIVCWV